MIHHTVNETTVQVGQAIATVICDSLATTRITTLELVYPRYIHSEFMTHRMFSRNASSSRATPLSVTLEEVENNPTFFDYVGRNKSGMVAGEEVTGKELEAFKKEWQYLGKVVADAVRGMSYRYGIHKQTLNRALEPWLYIRTLVTATEWENFFKLRLAPDAQPEIRSLALAMQGAMDKSVPVDRKEHLPYITDEEMNEPMIYKASVARCARVSYGRLDGKPNDFEADVKLYNMLYNSGHLSPFEHVAYAMRTGCYANYCGWQSLRNHLED